MHQYLTTDGPVPMKCATASANPERGPRCGECRLGLGVHEPRDPLCAWYEREATP